MGSLFGGSKKTTTTEEGPWKDQQAYVKDAFTQSQNLFNQKSGTAAYSGNTYAGIDPLTRQAVEGTANYATGAGKTGADATAMSGLGLLGQTGNYTDSLGAYGAAAGADNTQKNIANGGMYANNPYLNGQIDAVNRDIGRSLNEDMLPSIDRAAVGTGNVNSSRAGVAEGIAMRGAADQMGDNAAQMRSAAYNSGMDRAQADSNFATQQMGNAAGMYGNAVQAGGNLVNAGQDLSYQNLGKLGTAGGVLQTDAQGQLTADQNQWNANDARQQQLINNYYGTVGANQWGKSGKTTEETKTDPGIFGAAMGLGSLAASFMGGGGGALSGLMGAGGGGGGGALSAAFGAAQNNPLPFNNSLNNVNMSPINLPNFG